MIHSLIASGSSSHKIKEGNAADLYKSKIIIAIDIGHSKNKPGATSSKGISEYYFNFNIGKLLLNKLLAEGYTNAFIVNYQGDDISLKDRVNVANNKKADLFISIHHDSVQPKYLISWRHNKKQKFYCDLFSGYSIFYSNKNIVANKSLMFAKILGSKLTRNKLTPSLHHAEKLNGESRDLVNKPLGIYRVDDFGVIKSTKMPAVIFECGIIVNRNEELLLSNHAYKAIIATSIINSINVFFRNYGHTRNSLQHSLSQCLPLPLTTPQTASTSANHSQTATVYHQSCTSAAPCGQRPYQRRSLTTLRGLCRSCA